MTTCSVNANPLWRLMRTTSGNCACFSIKQPDEPSSPSSSSPNQQTAVESRELGARCRSSNLFAQTPYNVTEPTGPTFNMEKFVKATKVVLDSLGRFSRLGCADAQLIEILKAMEGLAATLSVELVSRPDDGDQLTSSHSVMWDARIISAAVVILDKRLFDKKLLAMANRLLRHFSYFRDEISSDYSAPETVKILIRTFDIVFSAFESNLVPACNRFASQDSASRGLRAAVENVCFDAIGESKELQEAKLLFRLSELAREELPEGFAVSDLQAFRKQDNLDHPVKGVAILVGKAKSRFEFFLQTTMQYAPANADIRPGSLHPEVGSALHSCARSWFLAKSALPYAEAIQTLKSHLSAELFPLVMKMLCQRGRKQAAMWVWRLLVFDCILHDRRKILGICDVPKKLLPIWIVCHKAFARLDAQQRKQLELRLVCPHRKMLRTILGAFRKYLRNGHTTPEAWFRMVACPQEDFITEPTFLSHCKFTKLTAKLLFSLLRPISEVGERAAQVTYESFMEAMGSDDMFTHLWACKCCLYSPKRHLDFDDDLLTHVCTITNNIREYFLADFLSTVAFLPDKPKFMSIYENKQPSAGIGPLEIDSPLPAVDDYKDLFSPNLHIRFDESGDDRKSIGSLTASDSESDESSSPDNCAEDMDNYMHRTTGMINFAAKNQHLLVHSVTARGIKKIGALVDMAVNYDALLHKHKESRHVENPDQHMDDTDDMPKRHRNRVKNVVMQERYGTVDPLDYFLKDRAVDLSVLLPAPHQKKAPKLRKTKTLALEDDTENVPSWTTGEPWDALATEHTLDSSNAVVSPEIHWQELPSSLPIKNHHAAVTVPTSVHNNGLMLLGSVRVAGAASMPNLDGAAQGMESGRDSFAAASFHNRSAVIGKINPRRSKRCHVAPRGKPVSISPFAQVERSSLLAYNPTNSLCVSIAMARAQVRRELFRNNQRDFCAQFQLREQDIITHLRRQSPRRPSQQAAPRVDSDQLPHTANKVESQPLSGLVGPPARRQPSSEPAANRPA